MVENFLDLTQQVSNSAALASKSQVAYAEFELQKYLAHEELGELFSSEVDETQVRQEDGKLSYLKSQMEKTPTENNVYALVDELTLRKKIDYVFANVFPEQQLREFSGVDELVTAPRDFKCMRGVHQLLDKECDGLMSNEYSMHYNKYVVDFCETTGEQNDRLDVLRGVIHQVCGTTISELEPLLDDD